MVQKRIEQEAAVWEQENDLNGYESVAVLDEPTAPEPTAAKRKVGRPPKSAQAEKPKKEPEKAPVYFPPVPAAPEPVNIDIPEMFNTWEEVQRVLDMDPPQAWLKIHEEARGNVQADGTQLPYYYLPIHRQKQLMQMIFGGYVREIKQMATLKNSIVVTMRVLYKSPVGDQMYFQDGIGASGASAGLVQMAAPAAASMAFSDAVKNIGRIFGRDLNKDTGEPAEINVSLNA